MNLGQLEKFVKLAGSKIENDDGDWVKISCPFAPYTHKNGTDNNPSMGIKVDGGGPSSYCCFSCMQKGSLVSFVTDLRDIAGKGKFDYKKMISLVVADEEENIQIDYEVLDEHIKEKLQLQIYDESWLDSFLFIPAHSYLKKRGVPAKIAKELDIRFDHRSVRSGLPMRDFGGRLVGFQGRDTTDKQIKRYKFLKPKDSRYNYKVWLGEDKVDLDKTVVLTEGLFDYVRIYMVFKNVLASLGASVSPAKLARLKYGGGPIVTFYDSDEAGDKARQLISKEYGKRVLYHIIPSKKDAGGMKLKELKDLLGEYKNTFSFN